MKALDALAILIFVALLRYWRWRTGKPALVVSRAPGRFNPSLN